VNGGDCDCVMLIFVEVCSHCFDWMFVHSVYGLKLVISISVHLIRDLKVCACKLSEVFVVPYSFIFYYI
jgi:hypothetical protein